MEKSQVYNQRSWLYRQKFDCRSIKSSSGLEHTAIVCEPVQLLRNIVNREDMGGRNQYTFYLTYPITETFYRCPSRVSKNIWRSCLNSISWKYFHSGWHAEANEYDPLRPATRNDKSSRAASLLQRRKFWTSFKQRRLLCSSLPIAEDIWPSHRDLRRDVVLSCLGRRRQSKRHGSISCQTVYQGLFRDMGRQTGPEHLYADLRLQFVTLESWLPRPPNYAQLVVNPSQDIARFHRSWALYLRKTSSSGPSWNRIHWL